MSVLLFKAAQPFCVLVHHVVADSVILARAEDQPWQLPVAFDPSATEVVHLGRLEVRHVVLQPAPDRGRRLVHRPWRLGDGGWYGGRRSSSYGHLLRLIWRECGQHQPDRVVLVGRAQNAPNLNQPMLVAGHRFRREVRFATLEH
jgi:hypothetical protein